jgi:hypothetical protein
VEWEFERMGSKFDRMESIFEGIESKAEEEP